MLKGRQKERLKWRGWSFMLEPKILRKVRREERKETLPLKLFISTFSLSSSLHSKLFPLSLLSSFWRTIQQLFILNISLFSLFRFLSQFLSSKNFSLTPTIQTERIWNFSEEEEEVRYEYLTVFHMILELPFRFHREFLTHHFFSPLFYLPCHRCVTSSSWSPKLQSKGSVSESGNNVASAETGFIEPLFNHQPFSKILKLSFIFLSYFQTQAQVWLEHIQHDISPFYWNSWDELDYRWRNPMNNTLILLTCMPATYTTSTAASSCWVNNKLVNHTVEKLHDCLRDQSGWLALNLCWGMKLFKQEI